MVSKAEEVAGRCLRSVPVTLAEGERVAESEEFAEFRAALERFLPAVLRKAYPAQWRHEAFDAFRFAVARKTGRAEAEFLGHGLLISDQSWTPLRVRLRAAPEIDAIAWVSCNVGDGGAAGKSMTRLPYGSAKADKLLASVSEHADNIDWAFSVVREAPERAV